MENQLSVREINFIMKRIDSLDDDDLEYVVYKINKIASARAQDAQCEQVDLPFEAEPVDTTGATHTGDTSQGNLFP